MKTCHYCGSKVFSDIEKCIVCLKEVKKTSSAAVVEKQIELNPKVLDDHALLTQKRPNEPFDSDETILVPIDEVDATRVLQVKSSDGRREKYVLKNDVMKIGRSLDNDIVISDRTVSRDHIRVYIEKDAIFVEDRDAKNPALLEGLPLRGCEEFKEHKHLQIGDVLISWSFE